jgi:hypothetical protein
MQALLQGNGRLSNSVMPTSPLDFIKFPDGPCLLLPGLQRVDSWMAKVELE